MRLLTLAISLTLILATQDCLAKFINDTTGPSFALRANDGNRAGPIAWDDGSIPPSLGCNGTYNESGWNPGWDSIFTETDFFDPIVQDLTYFFAPGFQTIGGMPSTQPVTFTLRASDLSGIKKMEIRIDERDVLGYGSALDGPTTFSNFPQIANAYLHPVYLVGGNFHHWEKRLTYEPQTGPYIHFSSMLRFSLNTFGNDGIITVVVEDNAGNISFGSVYLADEGLCD